MTINRHGVSIGMERVDNDFYLTLRLTGKLTHQDYEIITPLIDSALTGVDHPSIRALIDCRNLEGWEARAVWDDFKLGLKHGSQFANIAIIGDKSWLEKATKLAQWFTSGELKYFEVEADAVSWLIQQISNS